MTYDNYKTVFDVTSVYISKTIILINKYTITHGLLYWYWQRSSMTSQDSIKVRWIKLTH